MLIVIIILIFCMCATGFVFDYLKIKEQEKIIINQTNKIRDLETGLEEAHEIIKRAENLLERIANDNMIGKDDIDKLYGAINLYWDFVNLKKGHIINKIYPFRKLVRR